MNPFPWGALVGVVIASGLVGVPTNLALQAILRFKYPETWKSIRGSSWLTANWRYQQFLLTGKYREVLPRWLLPLAFVCHTATAAFIAACTVFLIAILVLA